MTEVNTTVKSQLQSVVTWCEMEPSQWNTQRRQSPLRMVIWICWWTFNQWLNDAVKLRRCDVNMQWYFEKINTWVLSIFFHKAYDGKRKAFSSRLMIWRCFVMGLSVLPGCPKMPQASPTSPHASCCYTVSVLIWLGLSTKQLLYVVTLRENNTWLGLGKERPGLVKFWQKNMVKCRRTLGTFS